MTDTIGEKITLGPPTVVRAFQPGDVVFVEMDRLYPDYIMERIAATFREFLKDSGVKVVLLQAGMRIVGKPLEESVAEDQVAST